MNKILKLLLVMFLLVGCTSQQDNLSSNKEDEPINQQQTIENQDNNKEENKKEENDKQEIDKKVENTEQEVEKTYALNKSKKTLTIGDTYTLKVNEYNGEIKWKSSDSSIATVKDGKVKAIKEGTTTITAIFEDTTLKCKITVKEKEVIEETNGEPRLNKTSIALNVGESFQLKVLGYNKSITWLALSEIENYDFLSNNDGYIKGLNVGKGAVYAVFNGITLECKVTVNISDSDCKKMAKKAFNLHNDEREKAGLSALEWNEELYKGALKRAKECVESFSHTRPNGESWYSVIETDYSCLGENIAKGQVSAKEVVKDWMSSKGHKANILDSNFTSVGLACYCKDGVLYWVTIFAGEPL